MEYVKQANPNKKHEIGTQTIEVVFAVYLLYSIVIFGFFLLFTRRIYYLVCGNDAALSGSTTGRQATSSNHALVTSDGTSDC